MGFKSLGGYAVLDSVHGESARYLGNLVELNGMRFTLIIDGDNEEQCLQLKSVQWESNYVTLEDRPIAVARINRGERYFFKNRKDTVAWLRRKPVYDLPKYSIHSGDFVGSAFSYMESEAQ